MLAADRQLLDAHLRNELQQLRRLEITNVVNRFQSALTPATLIAGFSMVGIAALDFTALLGLDSTARIAEPIFYLCTACALATSLYVTAVSSVGIIFGQRLTVQATANQGHNHEATVQELNTKFLFALIALGTSLLLVVVAATAVIWVKDPTTSALALQVEAQPTNAHQYAPRHALLAARHRPSAPAARARIDRMPSANRCSSGPATTTRRSPRPLLASEWACSRLPQWCRCTAVCTRPRPSRPTCTCRLRAARVSTPPSSTWPATRARPREGESRSGRSSAMELMRVPTQRVRCVSGRAPRARRKSLYVGRMLAVVRFIGR